MFDRTESLGDEVDKLRRSVHGEVRRNRTKVRSCQLLFFLCGLFHARTYRPPFAFLQLERP